MNIRTLCLGALCLREGSGYDIKKLFEAAFNHFHGASFGSIYPALAQLEAEGLVSQRTEPGARHPDRKIYSATAQGRTAFAQELLQTPPTEQLRSEFLILMFFAHLLPSDHLAGVLDAVEAGWRRELAYLQSILGQPHHTAGIDFTIEAGIAHYQAMLAFLADRRGHLLRHHRDTPQAAEARHA